MCLCAHCRGRRPAASLERQAHEDVAREPKDCFGNFGDGQESERLRAGCPDISLKEMNRFVWKRACEMGRNVQSTEVP
jgi:hypothetical protein